MSFAYSPANSARSNTTSRVIPRPGPECFLPCSQRTLFEQAVYSPRISYTLHPVHRSSRKWARYATCLRASTDDQETTHQHDAIDEWLAEHDVNHSVVDRFVDFGRSGADPGREQFTELVEAIGTGEYEYVIVWEISRLARLGSIYQRFFEECEDAGTTVAITDEWVDEVRPDGTGKLIADISAAGR